MMKLRSGFEYTLYERPQSFNSARLYHRWRRSVSSCRRCKCCLRRLVVSLRNRRFEYYWRRRSYSIGKTSRKSEACTLVLKWASRLRSMDERLNTIQDQITKSHTSRPWSVKWATQALARRFVSAGSFLESSHASPSDVSLGNVVPFNFRFDTVFETIPVKRTNFWDQVFWGDASYEVEWECIQPVNHRAGVVEPPKPYGGHSTRCHCRLCYPGPERVEAWSDDSFHCIPVLDHRLKVLGWPKHWRQKVFSMPGQRRFGGSENVPFDVWVRHVRGVYLDMIGYDSW